MCWTMGGSGRTIRALSGSYRMDGRFWWGLLFFVVFNFGRGMAQGIARHRAARRSAWRSYTASLDQSVGGDGGRWEQIGSEPARNGRPATIIERRVD